MIIEFDCFFFFSCTEYEALNIQLDQLNSALDFLESKNDNIHAELVQLLESNKETRKQIQQSQKDGQVPAETDQ